MAQPIDIRPMQQPFADLERTIIDDYVRGSGFDPVTLRTRGDAASKQVLVNAAVFAAGRLTEVECRSHYLRTLHGKE